MVHNIRMTRRELAGFKRNRSKRVARLFIKAARHKARGNEEAMLTAVADEFVTLGGIYIKFLQGVMLQHPLMKKWQTADRYKIFEDVAPEPLDVGDFLYSQLSDEKRSHFATVNREPFAAGSFGQVYAATLRDGQQVVIKVLRSHSKEALKHDLKMLGYISHLLTGLFSSWDVDLKSLVRDFKRTTLAEVDYVQEREFAVKVYEEHKDNKLLVIPYTYEELCTSRMLVQEYIDGISVAKLVRQKELGVGIEQYVMMHTGSDVDVQLECLGYEMLVSLFEGRPVHGDPHPGNIRLLPGNKVSLIDFGIQATPPKRPKAFFQLMKQYWLAESEGKLDAGTMFRFSMNYYAHDLYQSLRRISRYASEQLHETFDLNQAIEEVARRIFQEKTTPAQVAQSAQENRTGQRMHEIVNANNRFGLIGKLDDTDILRGWTTYLNVLTVLGKRQLISRVYARAIPQVQRDMPELEGEDNSEVSLAAAIEIVMTWLERVAGRDIKLFQELVERLRLNDFFGDGSMLPEEEKVHA